MQCLPTHIVTKFLAELKQTTPDKLLAMDSQQRRDFFATIAGQDNAQWLNEQFESKLILKNQQRGIRKWVEKTVGVTPQAKRDILSRVEKMTEILTPETEDAFLADLAAHKLGVSVTMEEAANIVSLSKEVTTNRTEMEKGPRRGPDGKTTESELKYGTAVVSFLEYINGLKHAAQKKSVPELVRYYIDEPMVFMHDLFGAAKAIVGSLDDSFVGRQGIKEFYRGLTGNRDAARNWMKTFKESIKAMVSTFKGHSAIDALSAEIWSDPDIELIRRAKLAVGVTEEQYPVSWPEKIPVAGILFKAGEEAYIVSAQGLRYRAFKNYLKLWRNLGIELTDKELNSIGRLSNSLGGRGALPTGQTPGLVNDLLWSPRNLKADIDFLTLHLFDKGFSRRARFEAAKNLLRVIAGAAGILALADFFDDDSVEWDPSSSDFGKIKIGDTRFSVAGSLPSIITLAFRMIKKSRKSTISEKVIEYNTGRYGQATLKDAVYSFLENKASPPARFVRDYLEGENFDGEQFSFPREALNTWTPIAISNIIQTSKEENAANMLLIVIAETFGINTSTYSKKKTQKQMTPRQTTRK